MSERPEAWRYFGRTGGTGKIVAVLPCRALHGGRLQLEHVAAMELLRRDGSWAKEAVAGGLAEREWMHGWLDEADELDAATVAALLRAWRDAGR